jgi:hypothetical protein
MSLDLARKSHLAPRRISDEFSSRFSFRLMNVVLNLTLSCILVIVAAPLNWSTRQS